MNKHEWIQSLDFDAFVELMGNIQAKAIERGRALTEQEYLNLLKEGKRMSNKEKLEKLIATVLSDCTMAEDIAKHLDKNNVIVLPCAIGSTVWIVSKNCTEPYPAKFKLDDLAQMGRRVFLSRADALRHIGRGARR